MIDTKPHFVLDGLAGWRAKDLQNTSLANGGDSLILQQLPGSIWPFVDPQGSFGGLQAAMGIAVDTENRVYILDGRTCLLKRFDPCQQKFVTLPCIGGCGTAPRRLSSPHCLAIFCCNNIYIADTGNCRVPIFSIKGLTFANVWGPFEVHDSATGITISPALPSVSFGNPHPDCSGTVSFPSGTWRPWDVVVSNRNWVYVSDYGNGLIHVFDPHGCWKTAYTGASSSSPQFVKPTRLALDREGRIYVVQESLNYVVVLNSDGTFQGKVSQPSDVLGQFCPVAVAVDVNGNLCLSDCVTQKFYFYRPDGDGGWCPTTCSSCTGVAANSLIFDLSGNPIFADGAQRVCQLSLQGVFPTSGYYYSDSLDSKTYRCLWHRVVLSGCVPPGTAVRVDTFTAESDKPVDEIESLPESRWATAQLDVGTKSCEWDFLSFSPPGRYMWLRLTLEGDGSATPVVEKVKVYYPRASSLQYLPAVYREDPASADFTARFLSIFDTIRGITAGQITDIARYFDPKAAPVNPPNVAGIDFLSWLAGSAWLRLPNNLAGR